MQIQLNYQIKEHKELSLNNNIYNLSIPYSDFENWALEYRKDKKIAGFREGKMSIFHFQETWEKEYIQSVVNDLIKKESLDVINYAYLYQDFRQNEDIFCELIIEQKIELPELNLESIKLKEAEIDQKDAEISIKNWLNANFKANAVVEREIAKNDFVTLKAMDGKTFNIRIGQKDLIKEIEDKLIGKKQGESIDHVFFDQNQEFNVNFEIMEVKDSVNYTLEDAFEKFKVTNEKELIAHFVESLKNESEVYSNNLLNQDIKKAILTLPYEPFIPRVRKEFQLLLDNELLTLGYEGDFNNVENIQEFLSSKKIEYKDLNQQIYTMAYNIVKFNMYLMHLATKYNINVQENEIQAKIQAKSYLFNNGIKEAKAYFEKDFNQDRLIYEILDEKVMEYLVNNGIIQKEKVKLNDLYIKKGE